MTRLVVVGNGRAADAFLRQMQHYKHDFSITVFGDGPLPRKPTWYRDREIDMHGGVRITAVDRHARVVRGSDGSFTSYERLILAVGGVTNRTTPAASLNPAAMTPTDKPALAIPGLQTRNGVMVNGSFETSDGYIYAIGDCAEIRDERWAATLDKQARRLAARLAGESDGVEAPRRTSRHKLFLLEKPDSGQKKRALIA